jgi:hypothetical protein
MASSSKAGSAGVKVIFGAMTIGKPGMLIRDPSVFLQRH